nr:hypothetical protein [Providencia sp. PROV128]
MIYGLFLLICSGADCLYKSNGYTYPDEQNCLMDKEALTQRGVLSECYPIEAIIRANNWLSIISFILHFFLLWWFIQNQWITTMKQPQLTPWVPGVQLLTEFDIKLGKLAASVKNRPCTEAEIKHACDTANKIILSMMRQDQDETKYHRRLWFISPRH